MPSVRFKIEMLAADQDASADLLEGEDREVCSEEVLNNAEPRCLVGLLDQEADNFRLILALPLRGKIFAIFHEHLPPDQRRPSKS